MLPIRATQILLLGVLSPWPLAGQGQEEEWTTLTVLFDNHRTHDRFQTEWGFSVLLETPENTVLFDTGSDGEVLLENMDLLEKDPRQVDVLVISHAHGDHTGGLRSLLRAGARPRIYLLEAFPEAMRRDLGGTLEVVLPEEGEEIVPGIRTTGQVGSEIPEQALVLETRNGPLLLTGCAHPGVVEMIRRAQQVAGKPVHTVLGGFHLADSDLATIREVVRGFRELGVKVVGPTHCSGSSAMTEIQTAYGGDFQGMGVGTVLKFLR